MIHTIHSQHRAVQVRHGTHVGPGTLSTTARKLWSWPRVGDMTYSTTTQQINIDNTSPGKLHIAQSGGAS